MEAWIFWVRPEDGVMSSSIKYPLESTLNRGSMREDNICL